MGSMRACQSLKFSKITSPVPFVVAVAATEAAAVPGEGGVASGACGTAVAPGRLGCMGRGSTGRTMGVMAAAAAAAVGAADVAVLLTAAVAAATTAAAAAGMLHAAPDVETGGGVAEATVAV